MALGTPTYATGTTDTDATLGPTTGIVAGTTPLNAVGTNQGDQLGITKNLINTSIALETNASALDTFMIQEHFENDSVTGALPHTLVTAVPYGKNGFVPTLAGTAMTAQSVVTTAGHPGQWLFTSLTTAGNKVYVTPQAPAVLDYQTGFFGVLAFRAVVLTGATLPVGAVGATTYGAYRVGFNDTVGTITFVAGNSIDWVFDIATSANWQLVLTKAGTATKNASTIAVAASTWYDLQIWVGATGVQGRCAVYSPTALPTLLAGGPFTTNQPLTSTPMTPQVLLMNGTAGVTSLTLGVDLVELVGTPASVGACSNFRGQAMTRGF
jgi:hypothetical protein